MAAAVVEEFFNQLIGIVDLSDGDNCVCAMVRAYQKRLGIIVGNDADAHVALHLSHIVCELGTEWGILNVVNRAVESILAVDCHACTPGAEVGMVVRAIEQIEYTVFSQRCRKISAHGRSP